MTAIVAEKQVVGIALSDPAAVEHLAAMRADDFSNPALSKIFGAIKSLAVIGVQITISTVAAHLESLGQLAAVDGEAGLARLVDGAEPDTLHTHRRAVLEAARERAVMAQMSAGQAAVRGSDVDLPEFVAEHIAALESAATDRLEAAGTNSRDATFESMKAYFERTKQDEPPGTPTNIPGLTKALGGGLQPGALVVLAARPTVGKSAEGLNIIDTASIKRGIPSLVFSLEMSARQNTDRLIVGQSNVSATAFRNGDHTGSDFKSLIAAGARVGAAPITWGDARTVDTMIAEMTVWSRSAEVLEQLAAVCERDGKDDDPRKYFPLVMIDHLHLLANKTKMGPVEFLADVTAKLKRAAMRLGLPILLLAQLNRASVKDGRKPRADDLRGGGGIEENADVIILIQRDPNGPTPHEGWFLAVKIREGEPCEIAVTWDGSKTRYSERIIIDDHGYQ